MSLTAWDFSTYPSSDSKLSMHRISRFVPLSSSPPIILCLDQERCYDFIPIPITGSQAGSRFSFPDTTPDPERAVNEAFKIRQQMNTWFLDRGLAGSSGLHFEKKKKRERIKHEWKYQETNDSWLTCDYFYSLDKEVACEIVGLPMYLRSEA